MIFDTVAQPISIGSNAADDCKIHTAVILAGGLGTGMFPWGAQTPNKVALPIPMQEADKPVLGALIDLSLRELEGTGVERIVIITTKAAKPNLEDYLNVQTPERLQVQLPLLHKDDVLAMDVQRRQERAQRVRIEFAVQEPGPYGTAVSLAAAMPLLERELATEGERIIIMNGDDILYRDPAMRSGLADACDYLRNQGANRPDHLILGLPVPQSEASRFGVLIEAPDRPGYLQRIAEKPANPPENPIINIGRYIVDLNKIKKHFDEEMARDRNGNGQEHFLTTVLDDAIAGGQTIGICWLEGATFLDCGKPHSYGETFIRLALATGLVDREILSKLLADA